MSAAIIRTVNYGITEEGTFGLLAEAPPYTHQDYPRVMYHASENPVTVKDKAAQDALGDEWQTAPVQPAKGVAPVKRGPGRPKAQA